MTGAKYGMGNELFPRILLLFLVTLYNYSFCPESDRQDGTQIPSFYKTIILWSEGICLNIILYLARLTRRVIQGLPSQIARLMIIQTNREA